MEKLIPNSDSTSKKISRKATGLSKRVIWEKKKKLRVGQEDKNDKQSFYEVRVRELPLWSLFFIWSL